MSAPESPRPPLQVPCPTCGEATLFTPANPHRPFCSARCQGQDFGAWANEAYRVQAPPSTEDLDEAAD